jgi:hypothetical protein
LLTLGEDVPLAYRAVLSAENTAQNVSKVKAVVQDWLISKRLTPPTTNGSLDINGRVVSHFHTAKGDWTAERWQLEEHWPEPIWFSGDKDLNRTGITSITSVLIRETLWLWIEVESPLLRYQLQGSEQFIEEPQEAGTPKVVRMLMEELHLNDLDLPLVGDVLEIRESNLRPLLQHLSNRDRTMTLFLGVQPKNVTKGDWEAQLKGLTRGSDGLAATVYMDSELANKFTKLVGFGHSVPAGGMRTFLPGVRPFDTEDAYRHKLLTPARIQSAPSADKISRLLRRSLVARLSQTSLPNLLLEVDSELLRVSRFLPFEAMRLPVSDTGAQSKAESENKVNELRAANEEIELWKTFASDYEKEVLRLKLEVNELKEWKGLATELDGRVAAQASEISVLESHREELRGKLSAQNRVAEAFEEFVAPPEARIPESFEELVKRISEFQTLSYVGRIEDPMALDEHTGIATAITNAWNTLRTLASYAELKLDGSFSGGFMNYTRGESKGFLKIPEFKPSESETVNNNPKFRRQREIPVPTEVDPSGVIVCQMHVDLQNVNNHPRMYFYDATGKNGQIYIGYIGEHLGNTRTN